MHLVLQTSAVGSDRSSQSIEEKLLQASQKMVDCQKDYWRHRGRLSAWN
jgi:hypothetical protein